MGILKRGSFLFAALTFMVLIAVVPSATAFASSGNYYISDININAAIDDNGNMSVKEEYDYVFDGSFNGIKREVKTSGSDGIYDVKVKVAKGGSTETPRFELNNTSGGKEIKIYSKSTQETKKFLINYKVKNVITKYKDLAELKWLFYENEADVKTSRVTVHLTLPQEINKEVKLKGEGPKRGLASVDDNNKIKLELNDMQKDDVIGALVDFPTDWVNTPKSKTINMTKKDYEAMKRRQMIQGALAVAGTVLGITAITSAAIYAAGKKRRKAIEEYRSQYEFYTDKYYSQLPSDLSPELVAKLLNKPIEINELMASILNLENKGAITFLESGFFDRDYNNLCFEINPDSHQHNLFESERYLVDWLRDYADRNVVYLSFIKRNANKANFYNKFTVWKGIVKNEAEQLNFYTAIMGKKILTNEYEDEKTKWKAFKAYLRDSGQEEIMQLKEKGIWDNILPYAMVLDVASGVISHIEQYNNRNGFNSGDSIFMNYWFLNYYTGMYYSDIHRGYTHYTDQMNSSSSGNFSGGGGGGFGGGGGSSAF